MTRILGIGGSHRTGSATIQALKATLAGAQEAGANVKLIDLACIRLPVFDGTYSLEGYAPAEQALIRTLLDEVDSAQGIILASPTYHSSISGSLKNVLELLEIGREDQASRLSGKAVGLVAVQGGTSGTGNNTITTMLLASRAMGGWVVPTAVSIPGSRSAFDERGIAHDPAIHERLLALGTEVTQAGLMLSRCWRAV